MRKLDKDFYIKQADVLAPALLGKILVRRREDGTRARGRITETECYLGEEDTACHAGRGRGKTERTQIMYRKGGVAYVYLCYGIHNMLNVVSGQEGSPQAVLIRGINYGDKNLAGPGRLTKHMGIDRNFNGTDLCGDTLWIEDDDCGTPEYTATPRIGIDYAAEEDRNRLWRFVLK